MDTRVVGPTLLLVWSWVFMEHGEDLWGVEYGFPVVTTLKLRESKRTTET